MNIDITQVMRFGSYDETFTPLPLAADDYDDAGLSAEVKFLWLFIDIDLKWKKHNEYLLDKTYRHGYILWNL